MLNVGAANDHISGTLKGEGEGPGSGWGRFGKATKAHEKSTVSGLEDVPRQAKSRKIKDLGGGGLMVPLKTMWPRPKKHRGGPKGCPVPVEGSLLEKSWSRKVCPRGKIKKNEEGVSPYRVLKPIWGESTLTEKKTVFRDRGWTPHIPSGKKGKEKD